MMPSSILCSSASANPVDPLALPSTPLADERDASRGAVEGQEGDRLTELVRVGHALVWRTLRNLGVEAADIEDALQEVFIVASRKLGDILPGREKSFLYGTAVRVASRFRRSRVRKREILGDEPMEAMADGAETGPVQALENAQARRLLDGLLAELPIESREVFVMYEIEELSLPEIAESLGLPLGTAASRLRRARALFLTLVRRVEAQQNFAERGR